MWRGVEKKNLMQGHSACRLTFSKRGIVRKTQGEYMDKYIYYEDIPKDERKQLTKTALHRNKWLYFLSVLAFGCAFGIGLPLCHLVFPDASDRTEMTIWASLLTGGLAGLFTVGVRLHIIRAVERIKNS